MAHAILMPKPGQSTEECTVVAWHKQEGDQVHRGDVLFEIETDKSVMDVEAFDDGVLLRILAHEGATVPVNTVCAYIGTPGEAMPEAAAAVIAPSPPPAIGTGTAVTSRLAPTNAPRATNAADPTAVGSTSAGSGRRLAISPRASRLAAERGIDPRTITGSGPGGRIVEQDVQTAIAVAATTGDEAGRLDDEEAPRPLSRMRRVIADRLTQSWTTTPHFTVTVAVDVTDLGALRTELAQTGPRLTVTDFVLAATARTLVEYPDVNAWTDGVSVWPRRRVHLGVAVSLPDGLVVPVIRDADRLTVGEIHDRAAALAAEARAGSASVDDLTGSTFTVSNLGMLGVEEFSAIINPGEAAILAVSSAVPTPVVIGSEVAVRSIMKLTLSADHRIVDGAMAARFLSALQGRLQDPAAFRPAEAVGEPSAPTAMRDTATRPGPAARPDSPDAFDLVVLGAGTGGYTAAFRAAQLGLKVALVDEDKIGGTCLHRGCIPAKAILESADLAHRVREQGLEMGIGVSAVAIDYPAIARRRDQVVRRMWTGLTGLVGKNGVEWVPGRGRLDGPGRVRVRLHGEDGTPGSGRSGC